MLPRQGDGDKGNFSFQVARYMAGDSPTHVMEAVLHSRSATMTGELMGPDGQTTFPDAQDSTPTPSRGSGDGSADSSEKSRAAERSDLCEDGPLFQINQVDQVTDIFHTHDFTQFKFDPESTFYLVDQLDMAQRVPLFYILGGHFPSDRNVVFLENFLEH